MEHTHRGNGPTLGVNLGKEALPAKKKVCPACHSNALRRSQMRGLLERGILKPFGLRAYRCEGCDKRFFQFSSGESRRLEDSGSIKHR
jgi:hypothetical protein